MKKSLKSKGYLSPMPVLIISTYNEDGTPDFMNAAWGTLNEMDTVALCLSENHKTTENIKNRKAFCIGLATKNTVVNADYVGIVSANSEKNKAEKSGFTTTKSENVDAPTINELPVILECKLDYIDEKSGFVFGNIVNTLVEETALDKNNNVNFEKLDLICFDQMTNSYYSIGEKVADAFKVGLQIKNK